MQIKYYHLIIQLLIAALVSLGIAQADGDVCPAGCSHCVTQAVASCCDTASHSTGQATAKTGDPHTPANCSHGSFCPGSDEPDEAIAGITPNATDQLFAVVPIVVIYIPTPLQQYSSFLAKAPPLEKSPSIYTLNCSYLI